MELREFRAELPSTQTEAVRLARQGAPQGTRVVARCQTGGRGRAGHGWASPEGNLYLSVVVRPTGEHRGLLPLAVGARLRATLASRYGVGCVLKWPNDLLVLSEGGPRKLAGILVDAVPSPSLGVAAVVGVGVNVRAPAGSYPAEVRAQVASLSEFASPPPDLAEVEEVVIASVDSAVAALESPEGLAGVLAQCRAGLHGVGRPATVDGSLTGVVRGLGEEGELWLDTPSGAVAIRSGSLVLEGS